VVSLGRYPVGSEAGLLMLFQVRFTFR